MHRAAGSTLALVAFVAAAGALAFACGTDAEPVESTTTPPTGVDAGHEAMADAGGGAPTFCADGKPTVDYPPGPYEVSLDGVIPPDLTFDGLDGPVRMKDYFEPCAPKARLLAVRSVAAWCGSCDWQARHTQQLFDDPRYADRVTLLDLLLADEDNMPPTLAAAERWRTRVSQPSTPGIFAIDAKYIFSGVLLARDTIPGYAFIDRRTMTVAATATDPPPEIFANQVNSALALLDGVHRPPLESPVLYDSTFTINQWDLIQGMKLVSAPPADPTNEYADVPTAAAFGKTLFSDTALSPSGTVSCATCHDETKSFADGLGQAKGVAIGDRNSPSVALSAHARWQFWDGRADTLWMQALGPFENAKEFAGSRLHVAHRVATNYAAEYAQVFGAQYPLPDISALPAEGMPGDAAYDALSQADRDAVTRIYVNVGKAIAAFERTLRVQPNALDRYAGGDKAALSDAQKDALKAYFTLGCAQCHWGPRMTDDAFHALRFPTGRQDGVPDRGRADVMADLANAEFVASSKWSDAPLAAKPLTFPATPSMVGAFKTPSLRGVARTAPYGHGGKFTTLLEVSKHYGQRGAEVPLSAASGTVEAWVPSFDITVQAQLPAILDVLTID